SFEELQTVQNEVREECHKCRIFIVRFPACAARRPYIRGRPCQTGFGRGRFVHVARLRRAPPLLGPAGEPLIEFGPRPPPRACFRCPPGPPPSPNKRISALARQQCRGKSAYPTAHG